MEAASTGPASTEPASAEPGPDRKRRRVVDEAVPGPAAAAPADADVGLVVASAVAPVAGWAGGGGFVHTNVQLGVEWRHTATPPTQGENMRAQHNNQRSLCLFSSLFLYYRFLVPCPFLISAHLHMLRRGGGG